MPNKPLSQEEKRKGVRFVRIRGKVVPIKTKKDTKANRRMKRESERKKGIKFAGEMARYHGREAKKSKKIGRGMKAGSFGLAGVSAVAFISRSPKAGLAALGGALVAGISHKFHKQHAKKRGISAKRWRQEQERLKKGGSSVTF